MKTKTIVLVFALITLAAPGSGRAEDAFKAREPVA